ncbi:MAG: hypothetical protein DHS20C01_19710 [marine bacterium B5-7]|nr:MAG: hypothetical protein DHS20C01_19710 [marine bacterium B5-7]
MIVYSRDGCHLCEDMLEQLHELQQTGNLHDHPIKVYDIDCDPVLLKRFNTRVPVLEFNGEFICEYFLDQATLLERLAKAD